MACFLCCGGMKNRCWFTIFFYLVLCADLANWIKTTCTAFRPGSPFLLSLARAFPWELIQARVLMMSRISSQHHFLCRGQQAVLVIHKNKKMLWKIVEQWTWLGLLRLEPEFVSDSCMDWSSPIFWSTVRWIWKKSWNSYAKACFQVHLIQIYYSHAVKNSNA